MDDLGHDDVPNSFLLEEIRLNRAAIQELSLAAESKVGRGEFYSVLGLLGGAAAILVPILLA